MRRLSCQRGFTLIEVLVSMSIAGIVFGATLSALEGFGRSSRNGILRNEASDNARNAIDRMARELRNVAAPSTGAAGALERAEPYAIAFQTIDPAAPPVGSKNASNAMRVRYCLDNSTPTNEILWLQVKRWTSATPEPATAPTSTACPDVSSAWESSKQLARYVTNRNGGQARAVFSYGPAGATEVAKISVVEPRLYVDVNPGHLPGETQLGSAITLRNANRPPIAAFRATEVNGHVQLNASESEDPDGLALTYKWLEGTTTLSTSQQFETAKFASGTRHAFTLEVADPGGLSSSTTHELTIK